jgi:acetoin utilization deacetylase AcuC-like enzyme
LIHSDFIKHKLTENHPEKPERITHIVEYLKKKELFHLIEKLDFQGNVDLWIKKIHTKKHSKLLKKNFPLGEKSSKTAVKACIFGIDQIINEKVKNVFCASRPPGHHALNTGKDEGFCFYNHVAIATKYIQQKYKIRKVLIVDWDYHHGNSTEYFFYNDPSVLFFSTHDANAYPGTGSPERKGEGKGIGFNVNIHLPCGTTDRDIISIFKNNLVKRADLFKPDFILISAGFDSKKNDPLGCFNLTNNGFKSLTKIIMSIAEKHCQGRILSILEGGYNVKGNGSAVASHIEILNNFNKKV